MSVKESFKQMSKIYDKYRKVDSLVFTVLSDEVKELKDLKGKLSMLDVGCGTGNYSIPLAEKFDIDLTGIDLCEEMLRQAEEDR